MRKGTDGFTYSYNEGPMVFPDPVDRPSRTIITGEGEITSFAVYDTHENFTAAAQQVGSIMGDFASYFTAPPVSKEGPAIFSL